MRPATKVIIDGTEYDVPVMKFKQLEAAYPHIQKTRDSDNPLEIASSALEVLSLAMTRDHPHMTVDWLKDNMSIRETKILGEILLGIMKDSGLIDENAEIQLGEAPGAAPSTETSTHTSQSLSLPDAPVVIGTP